MARRISAAWLASLIAVVGLGMAGFLALPIRSCPTCHGLAKKLADPVTRTLPFRINCPECGDRGSVTQARRSKGSLLAPHVSRLLQSQRSTRATEFGSHLREVAIQAGMDPDELSGEKFFKGARTGIGKFLRIGEGTLILIVLESRDPDPSVGLVLLAPDGRVLDWLHCACDSQWGSLLPEILDEESPEGAVVAIRARSERRDVTTGEEEKVHHANMRAVLAGTGREFPTGDRALKFCRVGVKNDRFEVFR